MQAEGGAHNNLSRPYYLLDQDLSIFLLGWYIDPKLFVKVWSGVTLT